MIFPPGFFLAMQHLILHLPCEARLGARVGLLVLSNQEVSKASSKKCRNKAKIEALVVEAFILEEVSTFTQAYYTKKLPSMHNPTSCYNINENSSNLSLSKGISEEKA